MNQVAQSPISHSRGSGGHNGVGELSTQSSPSSIGPKHRKRKSDAAALESSDSDEEHERAGTHEEKKHRGGTGVKRACNECRQQKLKCDVVTEPTYKDCERCRRLKLICKIDANFKRIGKRSRNAAMEQEIAELRAQLANQKSMEESPITAAPTVKSPSDYNGPNIRFIPAHNELDDGAAVASLMDLATGAEAGSFMRSPNAQLLFSKRLGDVNLGTDQVQELFQIYFTFYHPFVPLLDPLKPPEEYYSISKLLFWVIISVASRRYEPNKTLFSSLMKPLSELMWQCISDIPQSYNVVKALCLVCTWPLPVSSTSSDSTFMLCSLAMSISMQLGLHRPSHTQDFSKIKIELREEELRDRVRTWAAVNCVAQRVSTMLGLPQSTIYDWTLVPSGKIDPGFVLPQDTEHRLLIERFNDKVTASLYMSQSDPVGITNDQNRHVIRKFLSTEYRELEQQVHTGDTFVMAYLRAAGLHLRLSAFFDSPHLKTYFNDLQALYEAATTFLEVVLNLQGPGGSVLIYSTNYILQMIIAAGFTLLKLLSSFFANYVDLEYGKNLFTRTISAIRLISVQENDLPSRFAEVLSQFWRSSGAGSKSAPQITSDASENSLQLKVKCRMSMSLVYDSAWRWREEFQTRGSLDTAVQNPTLPDSAADSSATSIAGDNGLVPSNLLDDPIGAGGFGEGYNEVFDPLNWIFDGDVEFPKFSLDDSGLGGQGIGLM